MTFQPQPQSSSGNDNANALALAPLQHVSIASSMQNDSSQSQSVETAASTSSPEGFWVLVERFKQFAFAAIDSGDPSELHNAAIDAARTWKVDGPKMRRILAAIAREIPTFRETVIGWKDSDAKDLE